jgi:hypothetical protein
MFREFFGDGSSTSRAVGRPSNDLGDSAISAPTAGDCIESTTPRRRGREENEDVWFVNESGGEHNVSQFVPMKRPPQRRWHDRAGEKNRVTRGGTPTEKTDTTLVFSYGSNSTAQVG